MKNIFTMKAFIAILLLTVPFGCTTSEFSSQSTATTGSLMISLNWPGGATAPGSVAAIRVTVSGSDISSSVQKDLPASFSTGTIDNVPAGTGRTVTAEALDSSGQVNHKGTATNLTISAGLTTNAGSVTMNTTGVSMNMAQTLSDGAQRTTLAFSALAMVTGNLGAQSFFPPGKVADYTGFQYLRDNDPDNMGHNTSFLTRVAENIIYILSDAQLNKLMTLAVAQQTQIDQYGYGRFPIMKAFRRTMDNDIPAGSSGLSLNAVKSASKALYLIDGQISYDRAVLYAEILNSLDSTQTAYLASMKGYGWSTWPDTSVDPIKTAVADKMRSLPQGTSVAVMTYASDLFSWYAGSIEADVYFCPERHGTYFGSFFIKDAPAIGHEGYSIDEQLTATAGRALSDSSAGYVDQAQATLMSSLVATQKDNLYAGSTNIVDVRTEIATLLRTLITTPDASGSIRTQVLALSETYGELDGENNYYYAKVMAGVYQSLTSTQRAKLTDLRKSIMSGTYTDGTPFDFATTSNSYLYSAVIQDAAVASYISITDWLFMEP